MESLSPSLQSHQLTFTEHDFAFSQHDHNLSCSGIWPELSHDGLNGIKNGMKYKSHMKWTRFTLTKASTIFVAFSLELNV